MSSGRAIDRRTVRNIDRALRKLRRIAAEFDSDQANVRALNRKLQRASAIAHTFDRASTPARARALDRALSEALDRARALDGARLRDKTITRSVHPGAPKHTEIREVFFRGDHIISVLESASADTSRLVLIVDSPEQGRIKEQRDTRQVLRSAAGITAAAARLLPPGDRVRYAEEYLGELWDLVQSGHGRARQLKYSLTQLVNAVPMRSELRSSHRKNATP